MTLVRRFLGGVALPLACVASAHAFDLQSTTAPGRAVPSLSNGEIAINRADKNLFFRNVDGSIGRGSLLDATAAGRKAVEQSKADELTVPRGNVLRRLMDKVGELPWTPADIGPVDTTGVTPADTVLSALVGVQGVVDLPAGTYRIAQNMVWPKGKLYRFAPGAILAPDAGKTVTIKGTIDAPIAKIFGGAGKVVGLRFNRPDWWDAQGGYGNTVDSQPAFAAAYESARLSFQPADPLNGTPGGRPVVEIGNGFYNFCRPWDIYPVLSQPIEIRGPGITNSGGVLQTCASFTGYALLQVHGVTAAQDASHDFFIHDFSVRNSSRSSGATAGIAFNPEGAGYWLYGPKKSRVEDILVYDFPVGYAPTNLGTTQFTRAAYTVADSSTSNNTAVLIKATGSDKTANVSEVDFIGSRFVPCPLDNAPASCTNTVNVDMIADGTFSSLNGIAAVRFENTTFYRSNVGVRGRATNKASLNDIWLNGMSGTQFDGIGCNYVDFKASGPNASLNNIHVDHVYHTQSGPGCTAHQFAAEGGAKAQGIFDTNNWLNSIGGVVANFYGVTGLTFSSNQMVNPVETGAAPVVLGGATKKFAIIGNVVSKSDGATLPFGFDISSDSDIGTVGLNTVQGVRNGAVRNQSTSPNVVVQFNVGAP